MKVFVTGATGHVGSAVVEELLRAGHRVVALARSEANVEALSRAGVQAHRGSLEDAESLREAAAAADGVIHCAFNHDDLSRFAENAEVEKRAIEALGAALVGTNRPLVVASGVALLAPGRLATEETVRRTDSPFPRNPEGPAMALVSRGVRATAVRLSPTVHGRGDRHGFVPRVIQAARQHGVSPYIGDGSNVWPAVHRLDAAVLFRMALEKGEAGMRYHAVAEEGVAFKDIATTIGRGLGLPVVSQSAQEAAAHFGSFLNFILIDAPSSSQRTRDLLGWKPTQPSLLCDIETTYLKDA